MSRAFLFRLGRAADFYFINAVYRGAQALDSVNYCLVGNIMAFYANYRGLGFFVDLGDGNLDTATTVPVSDGTGKFKHIGLMRLENIEYNSFD